jgi:hypothetical protein
LSWAAQFPEWRNLVVLRKENDCFDFGGWRYALDHIPWREKAYRYFVFLNSSLRGPFVPLYVPPSIHWTTLFTQLLKHDGDGFTSTNNGPIKLVGLTITCYANRTHVQSMFWATDYVRDSWRRRRRRRISPVLMCRVCVVVYGCQCRKLSSTCWIAPTC